MANHEKKMPLLYKNKGADKPAHPTLLCFFLNNLVYCLVSVAEYSGVCFTWPQTRKTGYHASRPIQLCYSHNNALLVSVVC